MTFTFSVNVFVWKFRFSFLYIFASDVFNAYLFNTWWSLDDSSNKAERKNVAAQYKQSENIEIEKKSRCIFILSIDKNIFRSLRKMV